ncbi:hypothetical protein ACFQMA_16650 [Halosimplex aquaticum]|uniref:Major facilitator superfamily (MFS) profile domain-containing protein n=1 Tax=Halosimplex aquaticum TaxID=3026162 RepID=A0ABD5Y6P5_9EURY|nr:hypothetical protein [Halosimplex aquaticum]
MDEVFEVAELATDFGLGGILRWLLGLVGVALILGGAGLWLLTDMGLLVLPAALMAIGLLLVVAPVVLFLAAELF